jgi:cytochrome bd-type quinol oxidase subunit 2
LANGAIANTESIGQSTTDGEGQEESIDVTVENLLEEPIVPEEPDAIFDSSDTDGDHWALFNLLLALFTAALALLALISFLLGRRRRAENRETHSGRLRRPIPMAGAMITAVAAVALFFLTEDLSQPIVFVDVWTIAMAAIAIVEFIFASRARRTDKEKNNAEARQSSV